MAVDACLVKPGFLEIPWRKEDQPVEKALSHGDSDDHHAKGREGHFRLLELKINLRRRPG